MFVSLSGTLKGVMRVGVLAKGLLLHESLDVELVVLCNGKCEPSSYFSYVHHFRLTIRHSFTLAVAIDKLLSLF